jgi:restriction system protein
MKLRMAPNSLFAILLRSPWWVSLLIAVGVALVAGALLPRDLAAPGMLGGLPFLVISGIAFRRQWGRPGRAEIERLLVALASMPWKNFARLLELAFTRDGHAVAPASGAGADFRLVRGHRTILVSARRWKAATLGAETVRELEAAVQREGADAGLLVSLAEPSDSARTAAARAGLELLTGEALAVLLAGPAADHPA